MQSGNIKLFNFRIVEPMRKSILFIVVVVVALSCGKKEPNAAEQVVSESDTLNFETQLMEPNLTEKVLDALDRMPTAKDPIRFDSLRFEDGSSMREYLEKTDPDFLRATNGRVNTSNDRSFNGLISHLTRNAEYLCVKLKNREYSELPSLNGVSRPAQKGLSYVWGSSTISERHRPSVMAICDGHKAVSGCRDRMLYGLDCSGLINYCFVQAGLKSFPRYNTTLLSNPNNWNNALMDDGYTTIRARKLSALQVPIASLKNGDVVIWPGAHCGIILRHKDQLQLFQSNGRACAPLCENNIRKGPRPADVECNDIFADLGCTTYEVIRFEDGCGAITDVEGNSYETVKIGNQCWMKENLKATKFQDGTPIQYIPTEDPDAEQTAWWKSFEYTNVAVPKFPAYTHQITDPHGMVYNSKVILNSKNVCPVGWRIPSKQDYEILAAKYGWTEFSANGEVAVALTSPDGVPNPPANINISDFSALVNATPADDQGRFARAWIGTYTTLATSTRDLIEPDRYVHYMVQLTNSRTIGGWSFSFGIADARGHYIRCIKE